VQVINDTQFQFGAFAGRIDPPGHSLTLIVKGTFDLVPEGVAKIAEEQLPLGPDQFYPEDEEGTGSVRYESDLVEFKPAADLLLVGTCHPHNRRGVQRCPVTFQVGRRSRSLVVVGDRFWETHGLLKRVRVTEPRPFRKMPLRYEMSFGGPGSPLNPVGRGAGPVDSKDGLRPLPNIEDPKNLVVSPKSTPFPAGFGPLNRTWQHRVQGMGSHDEKYVEECWPNLPGDFDRASCNAAPPGQTLEKYLRGDEEIVLENLHAEHPTYRCDLPGLRVRCFLRDTDPDAAESIDEVRLHLDTLWVDADAEQLVLVWRGHTDVSSNEFEEIAQALIVAEPMSEPPVADESYRAAILARVPPPTPDEPAAAEVSSERWTREEVERCSKVDGALRDQDLSGLDLSGLSLKSANLEAASLVGTVLDRCDLTEANLSGADLTGASVRGANAEKSVWAGVVALETDFSHARLRLADFTKARMDRARLDAVDAREGIFYRARLEGASLVEANLFQANFNQARLTGADLSGSNLYGAYFVDARTGKLRLDGALAGNAMGLRT